MSPSFHLAFHVTDLAETRQFYSGVLGAAEGRSTETWVDFDLYGHQLSCHIGQPIQPTATGSVAGQPVPMPHFGVILDMIEWRQLVERLKQQEVSFLLEPTLRFAGEPGEQGTFFIADPSGNAIEIKGFTTDDGVFAQ
ncbi:VOC family protein [Reinekea blandensis]|uniref:VOC domain-containing protein n=1 Tax=Reinekea blandensis MED297 TaxID=314283 RepID=A4BED1_9GAMM|nr:VOC family protein [Reinekea blandensis]EAR09609.1 hypothetical protein MED297_12797 [Reinekea blandensis MED297]